MPPPPFSVVVIKPLALGDVLRTTPFLARVRAAHPDAHITYAASSYARDALINNPHIDAILDMGNLGTPGHYDAQAYMGFARRLRRAAFDVAVVLDRSPLMALLPFLARIPHRIGLHNNGRGFPHTTRVSITDDEHEVAGYLRVAHAMGIPTKDARCHFFLPPSDIAAANRLREEFGIGRDQPLVVIAPGGGVNPGTVDVSKRWPAENFARVAETLATNHNAAIALVGLPSDASSIAATRAAMATPAIDLGGQTGLGQLAALIAGSNLLVGNDSTPAQLAACVGTPSITVFTTTEPWIYGPYGPSTTWVYQGSRASGLLGIPTASDVAKAASSTLEAEALQA